LDGEKKGRSRPPQEEGNGSPHNTFPSKKKKKRPLDIERVLWVKEKGSCREHKESMKIKKHMRSTKREHKQGCKKKVWKDLNILDRLEISSFFGRRLYSRKTSRSRRET